ncbi:MAG: hypothetical protein LBS89_05465, partial [Zoogloeaceae bacterium]|nr:hypothetical protein [Zoogloeaceae bacterium]
MIFIEFLCLALFPCSSLHVRATPASSRSVSASGQATSRFWMVGFIALLVCLPVSAFAINFREVVWEKIPDGALAHARREADEFAQFFGADADTQTARERTALAMLMTGLFSEMDEHFAEYLGCPAPNIRTLAQFEEIDRRFGQDESPVIRAVVAEALTH